MKPIILIPAYNPDEKLITLVEKLESKNLQIMVVNDGSKQECLHIFDKLENNFRCEVWDHDQNKGKGAALKTGIQYIVENYPECSGCITADADGQHTPEDILRMADALNKNPDAFILGSRDFNDDNIPFKSKWGNKITSFVYLLTTGKHCGDTQTGLRGIPNKFFETCLQVPGEKYEYEMNLLMEMAYSGTPLISVPIDTIYLEDNKSSHFHPVKDSIRIYYNIFKYCLTSKASSIIEVALFTILVSLITRKDIFIIFLVTLTARLIGKLVKSSIKKHMVFHSKSQHHTRIRTTYL